MKKYIYLFLFSALIFSCSDSETDNSIDNLTIEEHIQLIKNHEGKIEISFDELPEVSQNHINDNSILIYSKSRKSCYDGIINILFIIIWKNSMKNIIRVMKIQNKIPIKK